LVDRAGANRSSRSSPVRSALGFGPDCVVHGFPGWDGFRVPELAPRPGRARNTVLGGEIARGVGAAPARNRLASGTLFDHSGCCSSNVWGQSRRCSPAAINTRVASPLPASRTGPTPPGARRASPSRRRDHDQQGPDPRHGPRPSDGRSDAKVNTAPNGANQGIQRESFAHPPPTSS